MLTAQVVDHQQEMMALLRRKLLALTNRACFELADAYKVGLQQRDAPPHSEKGEIPHAYFGWKPGGFGPVYEDKGPNNRPPFFASFQTDHLATYIEGSAENVFDEIEGYVGFAPSEIKCRSWIMRLSPSGVLIDAHLPHLWRRNTGGRRSLQPGDRGGDLL